MYEELLNETSKTVPTYHEKIMIALEVNDEVETLCSDIKDLINSANLYDNDDIVSKMKKNCTRI